MRFQVPQFIEVEDKIFGPLTLKQFLYVAGSTGMVFVVYAIVDSFFLTILLGAPLLALGAGLAFYKVNNKPLVFVIEAAVKYYTSDKLYIWRKKEKTVEHKEEVASTENDFFIPRLSDSKLKDLTWNLDIKQIETPATTQKK